MEKALRERYAFKRLGLEVRTALLSMLTRPRAPRGVNNLAQRLEEGELKLKMEYSNLNNMLARIDVISNRICPSLSCHILIAALLVNQSETYFLSHFPWWKSVLCWRSDRAIRPIPLFAAVAIEAALVILPIYMKQNHRGIPRENLANSFITVFIFVTTTAVFQPEGLKPPLCGIFL